MTTLRILTLSLLCLSSLAQDELQTFSYRIPFPERTYSGDWEIHVELSTHSQSAHAIVLRGFSTSGSQLFEKDMGSFDPWAVFQWTLTPTRQELIQSLEIESDQPLRGILWLVNRRLGQINAVRLPAESAEDLQVPHIANNYFKWRSSFALVGASDRALDTDIQFSYAGDAGMRTGATLAVEQLSDHAYLRRTPQHDLITESEPDLGTVSALREGVELSGFLTYARVEDSTQTCALELTSKGSAVGATLMSPDLERDFDDFFVFTNFNDVPVEIDVALHQWVQFEEGTQMDQRNQTITIGARQKRVMVLGTDLFPDQLGTPTILEFESLTYVDALPLPIQAIHLQSGWDDMKLSGTSFAQAGARLSGWLHLNSEISETFEVGNLDDQPISLLMTAQAQSGALFSTDLTISGGNALTIDPTSILEGLALEELNEPQIVHLSFRQITAEGQPKGSKLIGKTSMAAGVDTATVMWNGFDPLPENP